MKKTLKTIIMAVALTVSFGLIACGDNPDDPNQEEPTTYELEPIENAATTFAFHFNGQPVEPGATLIYNATSDDIADDMVAVNLILENLTSSEVMATHRIEIAEGPADMNDFSVCAGGSCPWNGEPYTLVPGQNPDKPITFELVPSKHSSHATAKYRVAVTTARMTEPTYIFIRVNL